MAGMQTLLRIAAVVAALLSPTLALAQVKTPIYVECPLPQNSEVGRGLCSSLRDAIAKSPRYALLTSPGKNRHGVIILASIPLVIGDLQLNGASASSVVFGIVLDGDDGALIYVGHQVMITGRQKLDEQAASLLVDFDTLVNAMATTKTTP
jgi:hypothetical protein